MYCTARERIAPFAFSPDPFGTMRPSSLMPSLMFPRRRRSTSFWGRINNAIAQKMEEMNEHGCPSADEPTHLNPYWHCERHACVWVLEGQKRSPHPSVLRLHPRILRLLMVLPVVREQGQHSNLLQLLRGPRAAQDLVVHWDEKMVQAQRERGARGLVASALATVVFEVGRVIQMDPPRVCCLAEADRVPPTQRAPPQRSL